MHRSALLASAFSASILITLAPEAFGQPQPPAGVAAPAPAPETAAQIRDRARTTLAGGDIDGACTLFQQAYDAATSGAATAGAPPPAPAEVLFELAACHERQAKTALAAQEYDQVAAQPVPQAEAARARAAALRSPPPPAQSAPVAPPAAPAPPVAPPAPVQVEEPKKELPPTRLGDFMDTRLSWTFGDDDLIHATAETQPYSLNPNVADRKQYRLFFDNLNSRFGGRENLTHLALYKKMPGFINNLDTEASLVLRFDITALSKNASKVEQSLYDSGSYIRLFYHTDGNASGKAGLGLTMWPIDTDRFRLGYLYDISWGGTNLSINQSIFPRAIGATPGAKLQFDGERFNVFAGFKTATIIEELQVLRAGTSEIDAVKSQETNYGILVGGGVEFHPMVHADIGGGYFQQGRLEFPDVNGARVFTYGASARVAVHDPDSPIPQSIDYLLYRNDPNKPQQIFKPETYTQGKTSWAVSVEASNLLQNIKDFDVTGDTYLQPARAGALQGVLKSGFLRASVTGILRDLQFVMRNQPGFIAFLTPPDDAKTTSELFFAAAADYYIESARLTPGIGAGLQLPATYYTESLNLATVPIARTVVVRDQGNQSILPLNKSSVPILQARASLKWDISPILSAIAWVQYTRDNNGTYVEQDPNEGTLSLRTFVSPDFFGLGTSVQARF